MASFNALTETQKTENRLLIQNVGMQLGPEWTVSESEMFSWRTDAHIARADGASVYLSIDKGRITVGGIYPTGGHVLHRPKDISVAVTRGAVAIAQEITRRFLPAYLPVYQRACEQAEATKVFEAGRRQALEALATILYDAEMMRSVMEGNRGDSLSFDKNGIFLHIKFISPKHASVEMRVTVDLLMVLALEIKLWMEIQETQKGQEKEGHG